VLEHNARLLAAAAAKLDALSPLATLARGYAVPIRPDTGRIVRSGSEVAPGDALRLRMADAELDTVVQRVRLLITPGADGAGHRPAAWGEGGQDNGGS